MGAAQSSSIQPYIDGTIATQVPRDPSAGKYHGAEYLGGYLSTLEGKLKMHKTRFYFVYDGRLYRKRKDNHTFESSSIVCDLRVCNIAVCADKRSSFRITTPAGHYFVFSAPDANDATRWVLILTEQAKQSLQRRGISEVPAEVKEIMQQNPECADCGQASPDWVSQNLGIMLCVECAFIHHTLGAHISMPKSLVTSTDCWAPGAVQLMHDIGNMRSNALWEYLASQRTKPTAMSSHEIKEQWIYAKYVCHHFIDRYLTRNLSDDPSKFVYNAAARGNNFDIVRGVAGGGNVRWRITSDSSSALHAAAKAGHLSTCQLLLYLNADPYYLDSSKKLAVDVATDDAVLKFLNEAMQHRKSSAIGSRARGSPNSATDGAGAVDSKTANSCGEAEAKQPLP